MDYNITQFGVFNVTSYSRDWNLWDYVVSFAVILSLILTIYIVFLISRVQYTAFFVYIIFQLACHCVLNGALVLVRRLIEIYSEGSVLTSTACLVFFHFESVLMGIAALTHVLITVNRLWAIVFPISYRNRHTTRLAVGLNLLAVLYMNIVKGIVDVIDAPYVNVVPGTNECGPTSSVKLTKGIIHGLVYGPSIFIMLAAYPWIFWHVKLKRRVETGMLTKHTRVSDNGFIILTWLTLSVLFIWLPMMLIDWISAYQAIDPLYWGLWVVFGSLAKVADPVFVLVAVRDLREKAFMWRQRTSSVGSQL